jgi:hypothetical protein
MRPLLFRAWAAIALLVTALPALAGSPVSVTIGPSRDGVLHDLQRVIDKRFGPGRLDVRASFLGARAGDPDPWMWTRVPGKNIVLTLLEKKFPSGSVGWYSERGIAPRLDGTDNGLVLDRARLNAMPTTLRIPSTVARFGFYVARESGGTAIDGDAESYTYFSNRMLNDIGPHGAGAIHAPYDGDPQMLVYDLGRLVAPDTWLVACEYSDTGRPMGVADGQSDDDYSDIIFMISGVGVTPTDKTSFGRLKALFR